MYNVVITHAPDNPAQSYQGPLPTVQPRAEVKLRAGIKFLQPANKKILTLDSRLFKIYSIRQNRMRPIYLIYIQDNVLHQK